MTPIVTVQGKKLKLTNLEKPLYPECGFTKGQVIDYYRRVADCILPHLKNRPVTLKRYPDGVGGESFYEKRCPSHRPAWVKTVEQGEVRKRYCIIDDLASLVWTANLASIELHASLHTAENLQRPTAAVFDLDPGPGATLSDCLEVSLIVRDMLDHAGLSCFPKTSGGKGVHLYLPLNTETTYEQTRSFAKAVARTMEKHYPERVVSKMARELRRGRVFIDWSQNARHKTTVCVYSLRAQPSPTVSMPVSWEQVDDAVAGHDARGLVFEADEALKRLHAHGDLFREVLTLKQRLPSRSAAHSGVAGVGR